MEKILTFETSKEHYHGALAVAWCFDDRFSPALTAFLSKAPFKNSDVIEVAGGAKALAGEPGPEQEYVLNQLRLSLKLHDTKMAALMVHVDCGAYGGSKQFADHDAEIAHHAEELRRAEALVNKEFPGLVTEKIIVDFDGIYRV